MKDFMFSVHGDNVMVIKLLTLASLGCFGQVWFSPLFCKLFSIVDKMPQEK